jgi:hypothetical protein
VISRVLGRTLSVAFGFVLAGLAALGTLFAIGLHWAADEATRYAQENLDEFSYMMHEGFGMIAFFLTVSPTLTLLPAIAVAIAGEVARIRSVFYYVAAGGLAAAVMPFILSLPENGAHAAYSSQYFAIFATAGFAGGFVYWLITGRNA